MSRAVSDIGAHFKTIKGAGDEISPFLCRFMI